MSGALSRSTRIASTPAAVWGLLTTTAGVADWYDDWDAVENDDPSHDRLRVGGGFRLVRQRSGSVETALCRVTFLDKPHRLTWLESMPLHPPVFVEFHLEPDPDSGGTVLTLRKRY